MSERPHPIHPRVGDGMIGLLLLAETAVRPLPICAHTPTQGAMNQCAEIDFRRADAALATQWRRTLTDLHGRASLLVAAQRAWLGFRDAECVAETAGSVGGTIHPMEVSMCRTRLTTERTRQLAELSRQAAER